MNKKNILIRLLFCLPFLVAVFILKERHTEFINNVDVGWQMVKAENDRPLLALDVYAPSGIKVEKITVDGQDATKFFTLINYPPWYSGQETFKPLALFADFLHPFLPTNNEQEILYTTRRYTYLYQWNMQAVPLPDTKEISITYRNVATGNIYFARNEERILIQAGISPKADAIGVSLEPLIPQKLYEKFRQGAIELQIQYTNLKPTDVPNRFVVEDPAKDNFVLAVKDPESGTIDVLEGILARQGEATAWIYVKDYLPTEKTKEKTDSLVAKKVWPQQLAAVIFIFYFGFIIYRVGCWVARRFGCYFSSKLEDLVLVTFIGAVVLSYGFFAIGVFLGLSFPVLLTALAALVFVSAPKYLRLPFSPIPRPLDLKKTSMLLLKGIPLAALGLIFLHNLCYCFVPATFIDGSGDVENCTLPIMNSYTLTKSFRTIIENTPYGLTSPAMDVLRAVASLMVGEPGIYLVSWLYVLLFAGTVYLIGKNIFQIRGMKVYTVVLMVLCLDLFAEAFHLGKNHTAALAFFMVGLYSTRYFSDPRRYILPAILWGFLSAQYVHFIALYFVYFLFCLWWRKHRQETEEGVTVKQYWLAAVLMLLLAAVFYLKMIVETGTCFPPGITPDWLSDFFLNLNKNNSYYKYLDNDYIRHFYRNLANFGQEISSAALLKKLGQSLNLLNFGPLLLLVPLLKNFNREKGLFVFFTVCTLGLILAVFPDADRLRVFYLLPLMILQFAVVDTFLIKRPETLPLIPKPVHKVGVALLACFLLTVALLDFSPLAKRGKWHYWRKIPEGKEGSFWEKLPLRTGPFVFKMANLLPQSRRQTVYDVFFEKKSRYQYLQEMNTGLDMAKGFDIGSDRNFDYNLLVRQFVSPDERILIIPTRFHSRIMRLASPRHGMGSVIYQRDIRDIMKDLARLNIRYLSVMPINYLDYNPYYSLLFEDKIFSHYCQLVFSFKGCKLYKFIYDGSNSVYTPSPLDLTGLPFFPMDKKAARVYPSLLKTAGFRPLMEEGLAPARAGEGAL